MSLLLLFNPPAAGAAGATYAISAGRAALIHQIALLHGLDAANPLTVSASQRSAGALVQSVSGAGTVTVTTSATPIFSGNLDAWIDGLAALHGLTAPLFVTATSRAAGGVTQAIATAGGTTTVTRQ